MAFWQLLDFVMSSCIGLMLICCLCRDFILCEAKNFNELGAWAKNKIFLLVGNIGSPRCFSFPFFFFFLLWFFHMELWVYMFVGWGCRGDGLAFCKGKKKGMVDNSL